MEHRSVVQAQKKMAKMDQKPKLYLFLLKPCHFNDSTMIEFWYVAIVQYSLQYIKRKHYIQSLDVTCQFLNFWY